MTTETLLVIENRTKRIDYTIQLWLTTKTAASNSLRTKATYEHTITAFRQMTLAAGIDLDGFPPTAPTSSATFDEMGLWGAVERKTTIRFSVHEREHESSMRDLIFSA
jgi:hypothetical protein